MLLDWCLCPNTSYHNWQSHSNKAYPQLSATCWQKYAQVNFLQNGLTIHFYFDCMLMSYFDFICLLTPNSTFPSFQEAKKLSVEIITQSHKFLISSLKLLQREILQCLLTHNNPNISTLHTTPHTHTYNVWKNSREITAEQQTIWR
jgi:hypothetical protein